ncbi:MAG TPA: GNAT family N-acetyltransferase [Gammaproteobacteria bacterium]
MPPELQTQRLLLQPLSSQDADGIFALQRHPDVVRYTSFPPSTRNESDALLAQWLAEMHEGGRLSWAVRERSGNFIGLALVFRIDEKNHCGEIGYILLPNAWGKGFASEIAGALIRYGFDDRKFARLNAVVHPDNHASIRVLEKHGFAREGLRRASLYKEGAFQDSVLFGLLNEQRINELSRVE